MKSTWIFTLVYLASSMAWAAETKASTAGKAETEHTFEDVLIQGKYEFADENLKTVEEDQALQSLISVRQDFKDRIEQSAERY